MNSGLVPLLTLIVASSAAAGAAQTFDFKDPKGVNNAVFKLDAPLEAISGSANGIKGSVTYDPARPEATVGVLIVESASLHVPNPMMKQHLHSDQWMAVSQYPEIKFEAKSMADVKTSGDTSTAQVSGILTLKGVKREITAPVKLTYLKDKLGARSNGQLQGDLLVIRTTFTVRRSDFQINPAAPQDKVADEIEITLSVAGAAPRS